MLTSHKQFFFFEYLFMPFAWIFEWCSFSLFLNILQEFEMYQPEFSQMEKSGWGSDFRFATIVNFR